MDPSSRDPGPQVQRWDAALYEDRHSFVWKHGAPLLELLAPRAGERILDLGCGTGQLTAQLAAAGAKIVGLDSSADMIAQARRGYPHLQFEQADARSFAFAEPFDAVFSNAVLHWVRDAEAVIASICRALRPGGRFVAEFGGKGNVEAIVAALEAARRKLALEPFANPWYFPSVAEYATLLEQGGLEVARAVLIDRPTPLEGEQGMRRWIEMFAGATLERVPPGRREEFLQIIEEELRPTLYREGTWYADYRRLRIVARRSPLVA